MFKVENVFDNLRIQKSYERMREAAYKAGLIGKEWDQEQK